MCNALDFDESYHVCDLVYQLGALYDKKQKTLNREQRMAIEAEQKRISARLIIAGNEIEVRRGYGRMWQMASLMSHEWQKTD